jgi:hypothetical protein
MLSYKKKFMFDNYKKSDYISSVLIGLFYKNKLNNVLEKKLTHPINIYIQQFIKFNIIKKMVENKSIKYNIIKDFMLILDNNKFNLDNDNDIFIFYEYISKIFNIEGIVFKETNLIKDNIGVREEISIIELNLCKDINSITIKDLLNNWILNENNNKLNVKEILNIPEILVLKIDRFNNKNLLNINVNINKKICLFNYTRNYKLEKLRWRISSIICRDSKNNNYYTIIKRDNDWFLFNDYLIPCFKTISMSNKLITNKIRKDSLLIIYLLVNKIEI